MPPLDPESELGKALRRDLERLDAYFKPVADAFAEAVPVIVKAWADEWSRVFATAALLEQERLLAARGMVTIPVTDEDYHCRICGQDLRIPIGWGRMSAIEAHNEYHGWAVKLRWVARRLTGRGGPESHHR